MAPPPPPAADIQGDYNSGSAGRLQDVCGSAGETEEKGGGRQEKGSSKEVAAKGGRSNEEEATQALRGLVVYSLLLYPPLYVFFRSVPTCVLV